MTGPPHSAAAVTNFLRKALASGALDVRELEAKARAAELLGERQSITHAKRFIRAKKDLHVRSVRSRFGAGGVWAWLLPRQPAALAAEPKPGPERVAPATGPKAAPETAVFAEVHFLPAELRGRNVPGDWLDGIASLGYDRSPTTSIAIHRWRQFINDCHIFVRSPGNWAERAASLVGTRCRYSAVAVVARSSTSAGRVVELRRDWALIERAEDRSRRVYYRRRPDAANALPWML